MSTKVEQRSYEEALSWLREHGFDLIEAPGTQGRVFLRKYNVSAAIQKDGDDGVKIFAYPGIPDRQRDFQAGQPRLPAVSEDRQDRSSRHRRPPESAAAVHRRTEGRAGIARAVQRIAGHGERVVSLRPHQGSRQAHGGTPQASLGKSGSGGRSRQKRPRLSILEDELSSTFAVPNHSLFFYSHLHPGSLWQLAVQLDDSVLHDSFKLLWPGCGGRGRATAPARVHGRPVPLSMAWFARSSASRLCSRRA